MKIVKVILTPEKYHLDHGPKLRDSLGETIKEQNAKIAAVYQTFVTAELKKSGLKVIEFSAHRSRVEFGSLKMFVEISNSGEKRGQIKERLKINPDKLSHRKKQLCKMLDPVGAKKFGTFARTKYGKAPSEELIAKAHDEWLDLLSNCEC